MHFIAGTSADFTFVYFFSSNTKKLLSPCNFFYLEGLSELY